MEKKDFDSLSEAIKGISLVIKSQTEIERVQIEKAKINNPNDDKLKDEEDKFFSDFKEAEIVTEIPEGEQTGEKDEGDVSTT